MSLKIYHSLDQSSSFHYKAAAYRFYLSVHLTFFDFFLTSTYAMTEINLPIVNSNGFSSKFIDKLINKFKYMEITERKKICKKKLILQHCITSLTFTKSIHPKEIYL